MAQGSDNHLESDANEAAHPNGPSNLQIDEIEDLKMWGWMDGEGEWAAEHMEIPSYARTYSIPKDAPVYHISFRYESEAAERSRVLQKLTEVIHEIVANADGTFSIVQVRPS